MMQSQVQNISQAGVLIADDSPLVVANLRILLSEIGFSHRLIFSAKDIKTIYKTLEEIAIDVFICDYYFSRLLNGKQIYEECQHLGLLRPECAVVMLTSETSADVVHSIVEAEPDDYVVKPYSLFQFKKRIAGVYKRKQTLAPLARLPITIDAEEENRCFERAKVNFPEYTDSLNRLLGERKLACGIYSEALAFYQRCAEKKNSHWVLLGQVRALIGLNRFTQVQETLNCWTVNTGGKRSAKICDELALACLQLNDRKGAKQALDQAVSLSKGEATRLLAYSRLCEMNDDHQDALSGYSIYRQNIANTHRCGVRSEIDFIRLKLKCAYELAQSVTRSAYQELQRLVNADLDGRNELALLLLDVHIELVQSKYKEARTKLVGLLKQFKKLDLMALLYLLYLLYITDNYYWFSRVAQFVRSHGDYFDESLAGVCLKRLIDTQIENGQKRQSALKRLIAQIDRYEQDSVRKAISFCLEVFKSRPHCIAVATRLITLFEREIPPSIPMTDVRNAIVNCEAALHHSLGMRRSQLIDVHQNLKRLKLRFNQMIKAV
ncbi:response regulator [Vibrio ostreicida]|uniref:Response regulator n=1 Tax=Vibrio ostreicida TaxID=526588 RepID=A0ABT8C0C3_9VIBR|nr:response regulator [Vibrio ostreicida]MDN3611800.1 response regulator [Vibrio ostreicida]MDN3612693.1 response regulator [Vibrio ostreicida]NPD09614.1 response regulator [Vibrio ostreicida]